MLLPRAGGRRIRGGRQRPRRGRGRPRGGGRRLRTAGARGRRCARFRADRGVRQRGLPPVLAAQLSRREPGCGGRVGRLDDRQAGPGRHLPRLRGRSGRLPARSDRPRAHRVDGLLQLSGGGAPGLPGAARRGRGPDAGGLGGAASAAGQRTRAGEGLHPLPHRCRPGLRRGGGRHGGRQRGRRRPPQAAGTGAGRRRHRARGDPGLGGHQRRRGQTGVRGPRGSRAAGRGARGVAGGGRGRGVHRLCGGARHGHAEG